MITIKDLNKTYDRRRIGEMHVLHDVSLTLPDTGFVCILGPSGCGKTSLLNTIGGLDTFDNGTITVDETSVSRYGSPLYEAERNRSFGYIFQNYYLLSNHSVGYNVYLGLHSLKLTHKEKIQRVKEALRAVEMDRYIRRNVAELSGGQQQRVAIARALARRPRVIFADEPTGNLDEANTVNICSLLRRISKTSLVVMVTHEQRIAEFFADRIITMDAGRLQSDSDSWHRGSLVSGTKALYTGDYAETDLQADRVSLRIFQEAGIAPVKLSVVALKDRIVIKIDDPRAVSCGGTQETPALVEGAMPNLTLEDVERDTPDDALFSTDGENISTKPGSGITFSDMVREARHMGRGKKLLGLGTRIFLVLLAALLTFTVADFVTLFSMDPEDFITTHSQTLEVLVERGPRAGSSVDNLQINARRFKNYIRSTDLEFSSVPDVSYSAYISGNLILQAGKLSVKLSDCSYAPMSYLDESTLIMGRLPENISEIVVDRWVLDAVLKQDGVAQNSIPDISYFLNKYIQYGKLNARPTIVGICDGGEPAVYMSDEMLASIGAYGTEVITLSTFQAMYPGRYDDVTLTDEQCIVIPANAGDYFADMTTTQFSTVSGTTYTIVGLSDVTDCYAKVVVADTQLEELILTMSHKRFFIYCQDKEAMTEHLLQCAKRVGDEINVTVKDPYAEKVAAFEEASQVQADGRMIVIVTVILLSAVMLYLLRRSDVHSRIGMLSVYRLLGIPKSKVLQIFAIESLLSGFGTVLPTVALMWAVIGVLSAREIIGLVLPWYAALLVILGILCFQLIVTMLPLRSLLKLPPARLAAKYDF